MIISDNRKAATVGEYVKIILHKDIVPPPNLQPDDMSCAFSVFLMQLPNHDYFYNSETGEVYSDNDFRNQMVVYWKCSSDASKTETCPWNAIQILATTSTRSSTVVRPCYNPGFKRSYQRKWFQFTFIAEDWCQTDVDPNVLAKDCLKLLMTVTIPNLILSEGKRLVINC